MKSKLFTPSTFFLFLPLVSLSENKAQETLVEISGAILDWGGEESLGDTSALTK